MSSPSICRHALCVSLLLSIYPSNRSFATPASNSLFLHLLHPGQNRKPVPVPVPVPSRVESSPVQIGAVSVLHHLRHLFSVPAPLQSSAQVLNTISQPPHPLRWIATFPPSLHLTNPTSRGFQRPPRPFPPYPSTTTTPTLPRSPPASPFIIVSRLNRHEAVLAASRLPTSEVSAFSAAISH